MNRREFLGYIGAAILAVVGVTGMLKAILHHDGKAGLGGSRSVADGYGSANYGGVVKNS